MPRYSFKETLQFFSEKLNATPPEEDLEMGEVELIVDQFHVIISKGTQEGSLRMEITLGLMLHPIHEEHLKELVTSNFLGINTGGCTLAFDEEAVALILMKHLTAGTPPQESWEWLHRLLHVAQEWRHTLEKLEEFVPLSTVNKGS